MENDPGAVSVPEMRSQPLSADHQKILHRLKRANGQLGAVTAAIEAGGPSVEVVTQLAAAGGAIDKAGLALISIAMRECLTAPAGAQGAPAMQPLSLDEIRTLFLKLA